jgi:cell division protease FtsH
MKLIAELLFFVSVSSLKNIKPGNRGVVLNANKDSIEAIKNNNYLQQKSIGKLFEDMESHSVESIFFSNDLKKVYSKSLIEGIEDDYRYTYSVSTSNPELVGEIVKEANKNKIDTVISMPPMDYFGDVSSFVGKSFDLFFVGTILLFIIRSIFASFQNRNNNSLGGGNLGMPFMPGQQKNFQNDKLNMQKANISLSSWAGSPEIFEECMEVVSYLKNDTLYKAAGAEIPRGILLEGPPGTGKTLIAKAIASEADANFVAVSGSEFVELFVGMGAAKVRNLFSQARQNKPCIIFIDEIDAVGKQRGTGINMGNDEREQTLNQILAEMDGFAENDQILIIAATNRKDVLDAALLRPGRFDRIINVPLPDKPSRKSILEVYTKNKNIDKDSINLDFLAEMTSGFSGAMLKNLINEAAINSARLGKTIIGQSEIENALEKIIVGIVKQNDSRNEDTKMRVSIHEIGHAFLACMFNNYFELKKVTIQSTYNGAGGYTLFSECPEIVEGGLYTKDLLKKRLIVALGGKAAEAVFYGENLVSIGAVQDLKQANSIAKTMIGNYGMGQKLKVFYDETTESNRTPFLGRSLAMGSSVSDLTKETLDKESLDLLNEAYRDAVKIISMYKDKINVLVVLLMNNTTLSGEFVSEYVKNVKVAKEMNKNTTLQKRYRKME